MPVVNFSCPHCKADLTASVVPNQQVSCAICKKLFTITSVPGYAATSAKAVPEKGKTGIVGVLAVLVAILFVIGKCSGGSSSSPKIDAFQAQVDCEKMVTSALKAPGSADFAPHNELRISGSGSGPWNVVGWVDAQNSFGAKIRSTFDCSVRYEGNKYFPVSISVH